MNIICSLYNIEEEEEIGKKISFTNDTATNHELGTDVRYNLKYYYVL